MNLRDAARQCIRAALSAVEPGALVEKALEADPGLTDANDTYLLAIGKAAAPMARAVLTGHGAAVRGGVLVAPDPLDPSSPHVVPASAFTPLALYHGEHPVPGSGSRAAGRAVYELVERLDAGDRLLCLISGGASSLLVLPPDDVSLEAVANTTDLLLRAGAPIDELNCVRKHLDQLKGGRLAALAHPAPVRALILSDVVADRLDVIGSGLVSPDPTTFAQALDILRKRGVHDRVAPSVLDHLRRGADGHVAESPGPGSPKLARSRAQIVGSIQDATHAAATTAASLGFASRVLRHDVQGEAREIGASLAALARRIREHGDPAPAPACLILGGETTVTVRGLGRGGPNQEVALGAARPVEGMDDVLVVSLGTDGRDGPTDAAGAWADGTTVRRARDAGLDPDEALASNDAYSFFAALDDLITTGPTGTNVMDLLMVMVGV
jgi:hydroxypyruvate reductase